MKQISIHPAYRRRGVHNDLAILHVNPSFELDEHINPICLPTSKVFCTSKSLRISIFEITSSYTNISEYNGYYFQRDDSFDRKNCIASGWGKDKFGKFV